MIRGDVLSGEGLRRALRDAEVAYYLVHSMESQPGRMGGEAGVVGGSNKSQLGRMGGEAGVVGGSNKSQLGRMGGEAGVVGGSNKSQLGRMGGEAGVVGGSNKKSFPERERLGAVTFATEARRADVARIVYLGGLLPYTGAQDPSRHLASRTEVQEILFEHIPGSVALRSAIIIGARSRSFRVMVRLLERLRVLVLPPWRRFRIQPIDARDVIEMLLAAAVLPEAGGRALDIGGPEILTYEEMLGRIAEVLILGRPTLGVRIGMTPFTARLAAALAQEDPELVLPLMEGLEGDLLPAEDHAPELLGVELHSFEDAVECALREWEAVQPLAAR